MAIIATIMKQTSPAQGAQKALPEQGVACARQSPSSSSPSLNNHGLHKAIVIPIAIIAIIANKNP